MTQFAGLTNLGWVCFGPTLVEEFQLNTHSHYTCTYHSSLVNLPPEDILSAFWELESLRITEKAQQQMTAEEKAAFAQVAETLEFKEWALQNCHPLEKSDLLTDAQRVEYLPKFVTGEALEVVKRNRGCSFIDIMKTLEERFGQTIRVTQARIEDLESGPKLTYGDNTFLRS
ncbi:hypothetical protein ACROYT_G016753 [Oculina patagonica]